MPCCSECQQAADAPCAAFFTTLITEGDTTVDSDSSSSSSSSEISSSNSEDDDGLPPSYVWLLALKGLYSGHYLNERRAITKSSDSLHLLLGDWKFNHPDIFCLFLRITPQCFDNLVETIKDDEVFHNGSN